jgi:hypothetical protein
MAKILGLPFDDYVKKQIEVRQKKLAKTQKDPEDLVVFNSNTSWVRLSSGVKIEPSRAKTLSDKLGISVNLIQGNALSRNLVLWGGISSFTPSGSEAVLDPLKGGVGYGLNNAYGFLSNSAQGLQPPPGIESITCNYKNNGALKQAQVKIKCFTRSQFEALEAVYLRLGYTMVLEWGNVLYFNNNEEFSKITSYSIPNLLFKTEQDVDPSTLQTQLDSNKISTSGNYEGMLAKVQNYSWNIQEDLSFSITLDLISVGDIIDSLKANIGGGTTTPTSTPINVNFSGSVENIASIQINRNASKLNTFFYELYDEIYKVALTEGEVSGETKEAITKANNIVDILQKEETKLLKDQYKIILNELRKYPKQFYEGLELFKKLKFDVYYNFLGNNPTLDEKNNQDKYLKIINNLFSTLPEPQRRGQAYTMFNDDNEDTGGAKRFQDCLDSIENFLFKDDLDTNNVSKIYQDWPNAKVLPKDAIINALEQGNFGPQGNFIKLEGAEYDDGIGDYIFTSIIERALKIDG